MSIILTAAAFASLLAQAVPMEQVTTLGAGYRQVKLSPYTLEKVRAEIEQEAKS